MSDLNSSTLFDQILPEHELPEYLGNEVEVKTSENDPFPGPDFSLLPYTVIVQTFSFLGDKDRAAVAKVCKKWSYLFQTSCLWRRRILNLSAHGEFKGDTKALGYGKAFGKHLRYLSVVCHRPSFNTARRFQKTMATFFNLIRKSSVREFAIRQMEFDRYWRFHTIRDKFLTSLKRFVRYQRKLKFVDLQAAQTSLSDGLNLLEALAHGSGRGLETLCMEDLFHSRLAIFR